MKFLCVACDEPMMLNRTEGPEEGSLTVVFACPRCPNKVAMLTNPWETQLIRGLDVRVGDPPACRVPMQFVRSTLAKKREDLEVGGAAGQVELPGMEGQPDSLAFGQSEATCHGAGSPDFRLPWSPEAEQRLQRVPELIRPMARQSIERFALERGYQRITQDLMDEARSTLGM